MTTFLMGLGEQLGLKASLYKVKGSLHSLHREQDFKPSLQEYHLLAASEHMLADHDKPPHFHKAHVTLTTLLVFLL